MSYQRTWSRFGGLLLVASLAAGCGMARIVRRDSTGGVIALQGERGKAMEDAQRAMSEHCRGPYTIVSEGEEVVGTDTVHREESKVTEDGRVVQRAGESTRDATEWRITYQCGNAAAVVPGTPSYTPPAPEPYQPPPGSVVVPSQTPTYTPPPPEPYQPPPGSVVVPSQER